MKRNQAIAEVVDHIAPFLKPGIDAQLVAADLIDNKDALPGDEIGLEVSKFYTIDGNPLTTTTTKPDDE